MAAPSLGVGISALRLQQARLGDEDEKNPSQRTVSVRPHTFVICTYDDLMICVNVSMQILIELPDGRKDLMKYRPDLTIGYVKVELAKKYNIPFDQQEFELNGQLLADPLSLSDYPAIKSSTAAHPVIIVVRRTSGSDEEEEEEDGGEERGGEQDDDEYELDEFENDA